MKIFIVLQRHIHNFIIIVAYYSHLRFKDMIKIIQMALESGNFPNYFCHKINILEGYSRSSMQQTAQNLKRVIDKNEFHTLLQ